MGLEEIRTTEIWKLYEKSLNYLRMKNVFSDTDKNYRMYNGNQWEGAKIDGIEQAQYNIIKPIVNYKTGVINQSLFAINFSSENYESREFRKTAEKVCELLNRKASKVWEKEQMDIKIRRISNDSAINDEGIMYIWFDEKDQSPVNEIIDKNDIYYGNEQSSDIQSQPYILIRRRKPVVDVQQLAKDKGISDERIKYIVGDNDSFEQAGDDAKIEKDSMCTLVYKLWREKGTIWMSSSTRYIDIEESENLGLSLYPVAHDVWEEKKGWSRGEGEVRNLIPNQLEINKTLARMMLTIKQNAYAQKVVNIERIKNPDAINQVGGIIKVTGGVAVDDVSKVVTTIQPTSMSTDVQKMISDLISVTRELKNASEIATGNINPEKASGKAILAIQQASQQPLTEQSMALRKFIEDIARIWLDMWTTYTPEGMTLEEDKIDPYTSEKYVQIVQVPSTVLEKLKVAVKIDITPKSPYDRYAQELSIENLLKEGFLNIQKVGELRRYAEALPHDSIMPKEKILKICDDMEEEQRKIQEIDAQAKIIQQRVSSFLQGSPDDQAQYISDAEQEQL